MASSLTVAQQDDPTSSDENIRLLAIYVNNFLRISAVAMRVFSPFTKKNYLLPGLPIVIQVAY